MIRHLERVVPEAPERSDLLPFARQMQETTRQLAFTPDSWTPELAAQIRQMFDGMAPTWSSRENALRLDALDDAFARGDVPSGIALEVGSGSGVFTPVLATRFTTLISVDLSLEMLRHYPKPHDAALVCADASRLPVADRSADVAVLINCFLFPKEIDRVLGPSGAVVWVSTIGDRTPIYLPADDVAAAMPGEWAGRTSHAGWGTWAVLRRAPR